MDGPPKLGGFWQKLDRRGALTRKIIIKIYISGVRALPRRRSNFCRKPPTLYRDFPLELFALRSVRRSEFQSRARSVKPLAAAGALRSCRAAGTTASVARLLAAASRSGTRSVWVHGVRSNWSYWRKSNN